MTERVLVSNFTSIRSFFLPLFDCTIFLCFPLLYIFFLVLFPSSFVYLSVHLHNSSSLASFLVSVLLTKHLLSWRLFTLNDNQWWNSWSDAILDIDFRKRKILDLIILVSLSMSASLLMLASSLIDVWLQFKLMTISLPLSFYLVFQSLLDAIYLDNAMYSYWTLYTLITLQGLDAQIILDAT